MSLNQLIYLAIISMSISGSVFAKEKQGVRYLNPQGVNSKLPFSEAVEIDRQLILSGQIGISSETKKLVKGGFSAETKQTLINIKETLERYNYQMSDVVKCTVILTDINDFPEFNEIYKKAFSFPYPARTTFAVDSLALNATIEIECLAVK